MIPHHLILILPLLFLLSAVFTFSFCPIPPHSSSPSSLPTFFSSLQNDFPHSSDPSVSLPFGYQIFNILDYGAIPSPSFDSTAPIQKAIDSAIIFTSDSHNSSGVILVPSGVFYSGQLNITFAQNIYLYFQTDNSSIYSIYNETLYPCVLSITQDTGICDYPFIFLYHCTSCGLIGNGAVGFIDNYSSVRNTENVWGHLNGGYNDPPGHGVKEYDPVSNMLHPLELSLPYCSFFACRMKLLLISHSSDIIISSIGIVNSDFWTVECVESDFITIENCIIGGDRRFPNNDGIDVINSRNMRIINNTISTGDDNIAIITHSASPIYNIYMSNNTFSSTSAAIKISVFDQEAKGNIYNITADNIIITDTNRGICFDPRVGSSIIENILFNDMTIDTRYFSHPWWGVGEPISITSLSESEELQWEGMVRQVTLSNIVATSENGANIYGNTSWIHNITMRDVSITIQKVGNISSPAHDWRPSVGIQYQYAPIDGFWISGVDGLIMSNIQVEYQGQREKYWGNCLNITEGTVQREEITNLQCLQP